MKNWRHKFLKWRYRDSMRLVAIAAAKDIVITRTQAEALWCAYSEMLCAGWLTMPKSDKRVWAAVEDMLPFLGVSVEVRNR